MTAAISLIVPVYNEERRLPGFIDAVTSRLGRPLCAGYLLAEVVVVDDGSTDGTARLLSRLAGRPGWAIVGSSGANLGKGNAIKRGVAVATGTFVLLSDVDLAVPLDEAQKLFEALERGVALALASRDLAASDVTAPWGRVLSGRIFNLLVRRSTGLEFRDTQCGFKAMTTGLAGELLEEQSVPGLAFDVEVLMRARAAGHSMVEVPVRYIHEPGSKVQPVRHGPRMVADVIRTARRYRRVVPRTATPDPEHRFP